MKKQYNTKDVVFLTKERSVMTAEHFYNILASGSVNEFTINGHTYKLVKSDKGQETT